MQLTVFEVVGLIGIVLVVSTGKVFNPLRDYLRSFTHKYNPSRWFADLISCSMCSGVWIGVIWGLVHAWPWESIFIFAGFLSLVSFATSEALGFVGILTLRISRGMVAARTIGEQRGVVQLARARAQMREKPRKVGPGNDISEAEADALLDKETEEADLVFTSLDSAGESRGG